MKKSLIFILSIIFSIVLCSHVNAKVTGVCSNCHTMHSSQGGPSPSEWTDKGWTPGTTIKSLLVGSCQGCHCQGDAASITADGVPQVFHTDYSNDLAGGNFKYVALTGGNAAGHNVQDLLGVDSLSSPPGYNSTYDPSTTKFTAGTQVACAGAQGCHGDRDQTDEVLAVKGAHHTIDSGGITGASVGLSYRFLNGILGMEDSDWEQDNVNTSHNEYMGANGFDDDTTISSLCEQCHGDFHSAAGVNSASPWLRHPTDYVLPSSGEYQYYNGGTGGTAAADYSMLVPLARPNLATITDTSKINPGTDIVMCLSCHRAHASGSTTPEPYYKLMRWDYASTTLLSATPVPTDALYGCIICHTSKN